MTAYPLTWPAGWRRSKSRKRATFSKNHNRVTIAEGIRRVKAELIRLGIDVHTEGLVMISSHLRVRKDGGPISDQREPEDPGVAVYWKKPKDAQHKVMAVDLYDKVADNLAALAATLEAMRAIERHGGAVILERAFTGFLALPAPNTWRAVLGYAEQTTPTLAMVKEVYCKKAMLEHPDKQGGSEPRMKELNWAMEEAKRELA